MVLVSGNAALLPFDLFPQGILRDLSKVPAPGAQDQTAKPGEQVQNLHFFKTILEIDN